MKLIVSKTSFVNGLQQVLNVVGTRPSLPVLNNVLLNATDTCLELTTTNLDIGIKCKVKAEVKEPGKITLPAKKLASIIKSLSHSEVKLECSDHQARITAGCSKFRIMGMGDEEFPALPSFKDQQSLDLDQKTLSRLLKQVSFAQSRDENRYILNGVYFVINPEESSKLTLVATDGRRLSLMKSDIDKDAKFEQSVEFILPAKAVSELERILDNDPKVKIYFGEKQVAFELMASDSNEKDGLVDSVYLVSKKIEGKFPNYNQVIPKSVEQRVKIERELLLDCIQRASLVVSAENSTVKLRFSENLLEVLASSSEYGEAHENLAIEYNGPSLTLAFNPQFLIEPLRALQQDEVFIEFKDELSPGVIKTLNDFLCVVMPLRLS